MRSVRIFTFKHLFIEDLKIARVLTPKKSFLSNMRSVYIFSCKRLPV